MLEQITLNKIRTACHFKRINTYAKIASNLNYQRFVKVLESDTLEDHFFHLLEAQKLRDWGPDGGGVDLSDLVLAESIFVNHFHKWGIEISEGKFKDTASGSNVIQGISLMSEAVSQATAKVARLPQELAVGALRQGTTLVLNTTNGNSYPLKCFDGQALFSTAHPFNYKATGLGTYSNYHKGKATSTDCGFLPLGGPFAKDGSGYWQYSATAEVSIEDGWNNLWLAIAQKATMLMADGETPRYMDPTTIVCSKRMQKYVDRILDAKVIAAHAGSGSTGGGSMDIEGSIKRLGFKGPVVLQELDSAKDLATFTGGTVAVEPWDWFLECEDDNSASELGAVNIGMREPWQVQIYGDATGSGSPQYELAKKDAVAAIGQTRLFVGIGEPSFIDKFEAPRATVT